ncbi:hypothetical protein J2741_002068 [Methanolinea mesophila]|nr:hypothetical protein [Methanolinea mesophila]
MMNPAPVSAHCRCFSSHFTTDTASRRIGSTCCPDLMRG